MVKQKKTQKSTKPKNTKNTNSSSFLKKNKNVVCSKIKNF